MLQHSRMIFAILAIFLFLKISCYGGDTTKKRGVEPLMIPLQGDIASRNAEISGLDWYNDQLVILPQYPDRFTENGVSHLFKISKKELVVWIDGEAAKNLEFGRIKFLEHNLPDMIDGFQGYEAVLFNGEKAYFLIEARNNGVMSTYLTEGSVSEGCQEISLNQDVLILISLPENLKNFAFETLLMVGDKLIAIYEANGINISSNHFLTMIDLQTHQTSTLPMPPIEFRITDATRLDEMGRFWVINYYWPGDFKLLNPARDDLQLISDPPFNFREDVAVERLIELQYTTAGINYTRSQSVYIGGDANSDSRNWEGIVRLDDRGFLIMTDKHPKTMLAFIKY
jgi:hypothetical protein